MIISYAQNFEDIVLWRALRDVEHGFYVDVGANDPVVDSVTKLFYERGWRGINIEPLATHFADLERARPRDISLHCAVGPTAGRIEMWDCGVRGWATADPAMIERHVAQGRTGAFVTATMTTLNQVCQQYAPRDIHFLKVDVEGFEAAVFAGLDLSRFRPWIIVAETTRPNSARDQREAWEEAVGAAGYDAVYGDGINRFYLAREHADLTPAFDYPPNFLDGFVTAAQDAAEHRAYAAEIRAEQAEAARRQSEEAARQLNERAVFLEASAARAEARAVDAETRSVRVEAEQAATEAARAQAVVAAAEAEARVVEANVRHGEAEARAMLALAQARQAETLNAQTETRVIATEARVAEAQARVAEAEARVIETQARVTEAEARVVEARTRGLEAQTRATAAEAQTALAQVRMLEAERARADALARADQAERSVAAAEAMRARDSAHHAHIQVVMADLTARLADAETRVTDLLASRSWRLTAPLRLVRRQLRADGSAGMAADPDGGLRGLAAYVRARPGLRRAALAVLARSPALKGWLARELSGVAAPSPGPIAPRDGAPAYLSPQARRVLAELKRAAAARRIGAR